MYKCPECGTVFEEPIYETVCYEELYGVGSLFRNQHYTTFANCPECGGPIDIEYDTYDEEDYETDE